MTFTPKYSIHVRVFTNDIPSVYSLSKCAARTCEPIMNTVVL